MKCIVYQSYRTTNVPRWITRCMETVRDWAKSRGYEYQFIDDRFLALAPNWFRQKAGHICLVTDLARLIAAHQFLAGGYECAIWVDADLLVFEPEQLSIETKDSFAFCREVWVYPDKDGKPVWRNAVNNSMMVFKKGNRFLDFYIDAAQRIALGKPRLEKLDIGTKFLSHLRALVPFTLIQNVAMVNPLIINDLAQGTERFIPLLIQGFPQYAANLCASLEGVDHFGVRTDEAMIEKAIDLCLQSGGEILNRHSGRGQV
jgi:hypothetical protein